MKCRGCGKEITWITMFATRKKMPVDPEPVRVLYGMGKGKYVRADGVVFSGAEIGDDDPDQNAITAYRSHFATCSQADRFRRKENGQQDEV